jgi:hypothetical protein
MTTTLLIELRSDAPRVGIQLDERAQIQSFVDQLTLRR